MRGLGCIVRWPPRRRTIRNPDILWRRLRGRALFKVNRLHRPSGLPPPMTERTLFLAAVEIADPVSRAAYLDEACRGNASLRSQVEALLRSHATAGEFLQTPLAEQEEQAVPPTVAENLPAGATTIAQTFDGDLIGPTRIGLSSEPPSEDDSGPDPLGFLLPPTKAGTLGRVAHYEVHEVLGQGGFGVVVRAFDEKLHRMVAIKAMTPAMAATSPPRKRFLREARSAAAIRNENIVSIYAVEEQPIPYLVMEYVPGQTLQQRLDDTGPLDVRQVLTLGKQIAEGLAAAHEQGLIHRDIKPSNILLERGGNERARITDFGLARAADDASLTQSGFIAGTPMYMAPEQARGDSIDQRADLFSLGSVLYVMCTGRPPFRAPSTLAVLKRVCDDTPRPIREIIPEIPQWLCGIISKLHAKNPDERFQSAKEVAALLGRCLAKLQNPHAVGLRPKAVPLKKGTPNKKAVAGKPSPSSSRAWVGWLGGLMGAMGLFAGVWALSRRDGDGSDVERGLAPESTAVSVAEPGTVTSVHSPEQSVPTVERPVSPPLAVSAFDVERARQHQQAWARYLRVPVEFTNSIGMTFRLIPPGRCRLGTPQEEIADLIANSPELSREWIESETPPQEYDQGEAFYMAVCETTNRQFAEFVQATGYKSQDEASGLGGARWLSPEQGVVRVPSHTWRLHSSEETQDHPVCYMTPADGIAFCQWLSGKEGRSYRLPTEAEWEYACRAGTEGLTSIPVGRDPLASYRMINGGTFVDVGSLLPNPFGLHDMYGNVMELASFSPTRYWLRGGAAGSASAGALRSAARRPRDGLDFSGHPDGFRIVLSVESLMPTAGEATTIREPAPVRPRAAEPGLGPVPAPAVAPFDKAAARVFQEAWATHLGVPVEYSNSIGMRFCLIPPGEFLMGSPPEELEAALQLEVADEMFKPLIRSRGPRHRVVLTKPVYIGKFEVTQTEYQAVTGKNPSHFGPAGEGKEAVKDLEAGRYPVENVSWEDSIAFANALSGKENRPPAYFVSGELPTLLPANGYRLPTEAEWEFACRAGTTSRYSNSDRIDDLPGVCWFWINAAGRTQEVGRLPPNPFQLHDMHGNVWEWVQDGWTEKAYQDFANKPASDPVAPLSTENWGRVFRGGSWNDGPSVCESAHRQTHVASFAFRHLGFRLALPVAAVLEELTRKTASPAPGAGSGRSGDTPRNGTGM